MALLNDTTLSDYRGIFCLSNPGHFQFVLLAQPGKFFHVRYQQQVQLTKLQRLMSLQEKYILHFFFDQS